MNHTAAVQPNQEAERRGEISRVLGLSHLHGLAVQPLAQELLAVHLHESRNARDSGQMAQGTRFAPGQAAGQRACPPAGRGEVAANQHKRVAVIAKMPALDPAEEVGLEQPFRLPLTGHVVRMLPRPLLLLCLLMMPAAPAQEPQEGAEQEAVSAPDPRRQRRLAAREAALRQAVAQRDVAIAALTEEYTACEDCFLAEKAPEVLPAPVLGWLADAGLDTGKWPREWARLRDSGPFHQWWNEELYLNSPGARAFTAASEKLEDAFLSVEEMRHPERFEKGFDTTPQDMVLIPGGRYRIGPHSGQLEGFPASKDERDVRIKAFYLDRSEVSNNDYWKFLMAQPDSLRQQHLPRGWQLDRDGLPVVPESLEEAPVVGVAWTSASSYARWAGKRLPTEEEWEAAAAGLEKRSYASGELFDARRINCLPTRMRHARPASEFAQDRTPLGVLSMAGNAAEWTADLYLLQDQGRRARALSDPRSGAEAVVRGGSFIASAEACRNGYRRLYPALGRQFHHIGFRCARDAP